MSDYLKGRRVVDPVLTSITRGYKNAAFVGERVFPTVLTSKKDVRVPTFGRTTFVEYDTERAVGTDSNVLIREKTDTLDLVLGEHDLAAPVDYREQAESIFNEGSRAIRRAMSGVNLHRELIAARLTQDEKVYRTGHIKKLAASDRWAGGKGDPIRMIEADMEAVRTATGLCPNLMTMGAGVMTLLKFRPAIQAAIGASERKRITAETLQNPSQIEEIVVDTPISLPSMKTAVDKSSIPADTWGDNLMLHYVGKPQPGADSVDEDEPSFDYTLCRKEMPVADKCDGAGSRVKYYRYVDTYKVVVVGDDAGYLTTGISK